MSLESATALAGSLLLPLLMLALAYVRFGSLADMLGRMKASPLYP